ncbi:MAG TPA: MFS transporter [Xanthobacteraceae bacterium]|nr:MFS transporter [Xanthobacteraceae bacterium]
MTQNTLKPAAGGLLLVVVIFLISMNLRPSITVVGPVLEFIRHDMGLSALMAGVLTSIPLAAFAVMSPWAAAIGAKFGMERTVFVVMLIVVAGVLLRAAPSVFALYAGSIVLASGIAVGNVLVPAMIKRDFPHKVGLLTSIYATTLGIFASLSSGIAVPLAEVLPGGWRGSLAIWFAPALIAALFLLPSLKRATPPPVQPGATAEQSVWRSRLGWHVTLFMGLQSMSFYIVLSWLASILQDQGYSPVSAGWLVALFPALGIPAGFVFSPVIARFKDQRGLSLFFSLMMAAGYVGLIFLPQYTVLWIVVSGIALGFCFPLALGFFAFRASSTQQAAALSGMAQSVGYGIAALGPVVFGALHDFSKGWVLPLTMVAISALLQAYVGWHAGRDAHIGDSTDRRI